MTGDPVEAALSRAGADLPEEQRPRFLELMRGGLADFDGVLTSDDLVVEIEAATDVPPDQRLEAAKRFAGQRRAAALGRRSGQLLTAFAEGRDVTADAERLLAEVLAAISDEDDEERRRQLGDYATECRFILSGGTGPNSLRGAKLV